MATLPKMLSPELGKQESLLSQGNRAMPQLSFLV